MADLQALVKQVLAAASDDPDVMSGLQTDPKAVISSILGNSAGTSEVSQIAAMLGKMDIEGLKGRIAGEDGKVDKSDFLGEDGKFGIVDIADLAGRLMK